MTKRVVLFTVLVTLVGAGVALTGANTPERASHRPVALPANTALTPAVTAVLRRACVDCHSNATTWPWYSHIPPASWLITRDVTRGRQKLNFSEWPQKQRLSQNQMQEICDAVEAGAMPPAAYTFMHRDARLSAQDVRTMCEWPTTAKSATSRTHSGARPLPGRTGASVALRRAQ